MNTQASKAISIRQPWANLIQIGEKTIETRTWSTEYRGDLIICSSKKPDENVRLDINRIRSDGAIWTFDPETGHADYLFFGYALCKVELYDVVKMTEKHEALACCLVYPGAFAWLLRNVRPVKPFKVAGKLRLFEIA
jgi:hypothetical protein